MKTPTKKTSSTKTKGGKSTTPAKPSKKPAVKRADAAANTRAAATRTAPATASANPPGRALTPSALKRAKALHQEQLEKLMQAYPLQDNVPVPENVRQRYADKLRGRRSTKPIGVRVTPGGKQPQYPLMAMRPGQSFTVPGRKPSEISGSLASYKRKGHIFVPVSEGDATRVFRLT